MLHADFKQLQWIMNAYTIAVTTVLMATGTLADRYGRKRVFLVSIAAFGLTSLICGLADERLDAHRRSVSSGLERRRDADLPDAVLSHEFQGGRERAVALGWWGVIFGIGLGFGPIIGGGDRRGLELEMGVPHPRAVRGRGVRARCDGRP